MPRTNSSQTGSPSRNRSRGAVRSPSTPRRAGSVEATADAPSSPTYDEIAEAAYHRYLSRGGVDGQDFDDWLEAERELRSRRSS